MNLLSPWFLAGVALIAGPIIFHLIRRATKDRIRFSATHFLKESPPRLERKSRIQNPWLLALRCLVIALLALAFARPFIESNLPITPSVSPPNTLVLILDSSASMQREGAWTNAIQQAESYIEDLESQDQLSIISVASNAQLKLPFDRWSEWPPNERQTLAKALLSEMKPSWGSSQLDDAIELALAELEQVDEGATATSKKRIVLLSDLQKSARIAGIAGREWPEECQFEITTISGTHSGNVGIYWLGWTGEEDQRKMRIGVRGSGETDDPELELSLSDAASGTVLSEPTNLYSNSGDKSLVLLDVPAGAEGPFKVTLSGDSDSFDNTLFVAEERPRPMGLHYFGEIENADNPNQAAFYIKRATRGWEDPIVNFGTPDRVDAEGNRAAPFILIDSVLDQNSVASVRSRISEGSHGLLLLDHPDRIEVAASLLGENGWRAGTENQTDSRLGTIDFQHPSFNLFADPRFSDFSRIRFWHTHTVRLPEDSNAVAIAQYDDESPAILEASIGTGTLTIWVGNWAPKYSQWVLSTKFVPWLQRLFERAAGGPDQPSVVNIDAVRSQFSSPTASWQLLGADVSSSETPALPGLYRLRDGRSDRWVALQISSEESEWETHAFEDWERLGAPLGGSSSLAESKIPTEAELRTQNAVELESQQQIWRWVIILVAILLATESLIARKLQNREDTVTV